jgi:hypothetical protein
MSFEPRINALERLMNVNILSWLPFVVFAMGAAMFIWLRLRGLKKRQEKMQLVASELGLAYQVVQPGEYDGRLAKYSFLNHGSGRQKSNFIVATTDELSLVVFDYRYSSNSGKNRKMYNQTIAWVTSDQLVMPEFYISPESWLDRVGDFFLRQDIDFQEDPIFSKAFVLSGKNRDQIKQFFNAQRREALLKISLPSIECFPGELLFYRPGQLIAPDQLKSIMNEAFELYQAFATKPASE